jgi:hypothetical protein
MKTVRDLILELAGYDPDLIVAVADPHDEIGLPYGMILLGREVLNEYDDEEIIETQEPSEATHIILSM